MAGSIRTIERDTEMYTYELAKAISRDRQREIERQLREGPLAREPRPGNSVRRRIGRQLIRIGSTLAADAPLQLAARR